MDVSQKLQDFFSHYRQVNLRKGEVLLRPDDTPQGIYCIQHGIIKKYAISRNGREVVVNIFKPGAFFPVPWLLNGTAISYFYETTEPTDLWKAPKQDVLQFLHDNPDVVWDLLSRIYIGLEGVQSRIVSIMSGDAKERLINEIVIAAKRFGTQTAQGIKFTITEKDLADRTGLTRETVSREIKNLKDLRLIEFEKHILIIANLRKLEEYSLSE